MSWGWFSHTIDKLVRQIVTILAIIATVMLVVLQGASMNYVTLLLGKGAFVKCDDIKCLDLCKTFRTRASRQLLNSPCIPYDVFNN